MPDKANFINIYKSRKLGKSRRCKFDIDVKGNILPCAIVEIEKAEPQTVQHRKGVHRNSLQVHKYRNWPVA